MSDDRGKRIRTDYWRERSRKQMADPEFREKDRLRRKGRVVGPEEKARRAEREKAYRALKKLTPQYAARTVASNAIQSGKLIKQPCEVCGLEKSEAHHDDYSLPLSVRWLCRDHHAEHHRKEFWKSKEEGKNG